MSKTIFISKNATETQELKVLIEEQGDRLISQSFLSYKEVKSFADQSYNCIFFSSPRSVIFYMKNNSISPNATIACTGQKTAELLKQLGYQVDFNGSDYTLPIDEIALAFKKWNKANKVLFPISSRSNKTFSSIIESSLKEELVVYETNIEEHHISRSDVYVFTSPSNVEGFLKKNVIAENAVVIAWGETTSKALIKNAVHVTHTLITPTMHSLYQYLYMKNPS